MINNSCQRVTVSISDRDVVEIDDGPKAWVVVSSPVRQPNALPGAAEVKTKVSKPIVDSLSNDIAIVLWLLTDNSKQSEVTGQGGVEIGWLLND